MQSTINFSFRYHSRRTYALAKSRPRPLCDPLSYDPSPESRVRDFKFVRTPVLLIAESGAIDPGIRSPDSLNAESGAIDPGIRSPDSLNAESGSGGVSRGLGVTLSATIDP